MKYDVAVVGAGPAGSYCSWKMAEKGLKVYMIDKREEIGSPKRCGEAISKYAFDELGLKYSKKYVAQRMYGFRLVAPNGTDIVLKKRNDKRLRGYILERKAFDKHLAVKAANAGVNVQAKTACTGVIKKKGIMGIRCERLRKKFEVESALTIAADGVDSKVSRWAGIDTTLKLNEIGSGVQFEMAGIDLYDPHVTEFFFGNSIAPGGYVWVFPKGKDSANVGIGVRGASEKKAIRYLEEWVGSQERFKNGSIVEINSGGVPVAGTIKSFVSDGFAIVGDAARQVNPVHGGGMAFAMNAGRMLSDVACQAIGKGDVSKKALSDYDKQWEEEYGSRMNNLLKLKNFAERLSDEHLNMFPLVIDGEGIMNLMGGEFRKAAATLAKKAPEIRKVIVDSLFG